MLRIVPVAVAMLLVAPAVPPARASSEDAWAAFRANVEAACLAAVVDVLEDARAAVDPFGSPSFGLAVLRGKENGGDGSAMVVCVYDKQNRSAEIGSAIEETDGRDRTRGVDGGGAGGGS